MTFCSLSAYPTTMAVELARLRRLRISRSAVAGTPSRISRTACVGLTWDASEARGLRACLIARRASAAVRGFVGFDRRLDVFLGERALMALLELRVREEPMVLRTSLYVVLW